MSNLKGIIDCGVNLTHFEKNWQEVLLEAKQAGVSAVIGTGVTLESQTWYEEICQKDSSGILKGYTLGVHPHNASKTSLEKIDQALSTTLSPNVKAIGEIGLDYNRMSSPRNTQLEIFEKFLSIAREKHKGVGLFLHERDAFEDFYSILLREEGNNPLLVHSFTGSKERLVRYLDLGCFISINGYVTDIRRNQELIQALKYCPLDRLMLETDAPYLKPKVPALQKHSKNYPRNVGYVGHYVYENFYKNSVSVEKFLSTVENTTKLFFKID